MTKKIVQRVRQTKIKRVQIVTHTKKMLMGKEIDDH